MPISRFFDWVKCHRLLGLAVLIVFCLSSSAIALYSRNRFESNDPLHSFAGNVIDDYQDPAVYAKIFIKSLKSDEKLIAMTDQHGAFAFDTRIRPEDIGHLVIRAESEDGAKIGYCHNIRVREPKHNQHLEITTSAKRTEHVRVVDSNGQPIVNANVAIQMKSPNWVGPVVTDSNGTVSIDLPQKEKIERAIAWKDGVGLQFRDYGVRLRHKRPDVVRPDFPFGKLEELQLDGVTPIQVSVVDDQGQPIAGARVHVLTLADLKDNKFFIPATLGKCLSAKTDATGTATIDWFPKWHTRKIKIIASRHGFIHKVATTISESPSPQIDIKLDREVILSGHLTLQDGEPVAAQMVFLNSNVDREGAVHESALTDETGRYEFRVASSRTYAVHTQSGQGVAMHSGIRAMPGDHEATCDLQLQHPNHLHVKVVNATTGQPAPSIDLALYVPTAVDGAPDSSPIKNAVPIATIKTDSSGEYKIALARGDYFLVAHDMQDARFTIGDQQDKQIDLTITPPPMVEYVGRVVIDESGQPAANVRVGSMELRGNSHRFWEIDTDQEGKFMIRRPKGSSVISAMSADNRLGAITKISADDTQVELRLGNCGSAAGRLMNQAGSAPKPRAEIELAIDAENCANESFTRLAHIDNDGNFEVDQLIPGPYVLREKTHGHHPSPAIVRFKVEPGQKVQIGDVRLADQVADLK